MKIYQVGLQKGLRSPFKPADELQKIDEAEAREEEEEKTAGSAESEVLPPIQIDLDLFDAGPVPLPAAFRTLSNTHLAQDGHHWAPVGESRLKEIQPHEGREEVEVGTHGVAEYHGGHDEESGDHSQETVDRHFVVLLVFVAHFGAYGEVSESLYCLLLTR
jgi:hypothetical protein